MTAAETPLATIYEGWENYQRHLTSAIAPLSSEQLALRAAPDLRPVWMLAAHIISARVWWFHFVLREGDDKLAPLVDWDEDDSPQRSAAELVEGLEASWRLVKSGLDYWTPADLAQTYQHPRREKTYSRQWVIWHLIEHDIHHGGELSFALGMHGVPAIDL